MVKYYLDEIFHASKGSYNILIYCIEIIFFKSMIRTFAVFPKPVNIRAFMKPAQNYIF